MTAKAGGPAAPPDPAPGPAHDAPGGRGVIIPPHIAAENLAVPGPGATRFALGGETMGTTWSAVFYAPADFTPGHVAVEIDRALARTVAQMSLWEADSDIARFNRAPAGAWVRLPVPFFSVVAEALEIAEDTDGAFDPCMADLADIWGFGPGGPKTRAPEAAALEAARGRPGWRDLELDAGGKRLRQPGGAMLDLNAIAKGDAVDRIAEVLDGQGLKSWLAEIGGELRGRGLKPDRSPWWARLETDADSGPGAGPGFVAAISGLAVATSGAYRRVMEAGGARYCHVLDAGSGMALAPDLSAVTVFAGRCARADALATALLAMGGDKGMDFARDRGLAALFSAGGPTHSASPALQAMLDAPLST